MDSGSEQPRVPLAEYIFLLPQVLAVSPLFAVFLHIREFGDNADPQYGFRLITLAYMLMVTTIILYIWRPSIRQANSFRRNLSRATCLGVLATLPIPLSVRILSHYDNVSVQLFTSFETVVAGFALLSCLLVNIACLVTLFRALPVAKVRRFDYLSVVVNLAVVGLFVKWW
ncbi:MAG: hypothetical protein AB8G18_13230 [Gammaproteobacteria bacterium]